MEKDWLIRTQNNHLLGPVSLKKIRELINKGSLKAEDEVSCGNGYWFFVREAELVQKYINNEIPQGFNPVSEADTVLSKVSSDLETLEEELDLEVKVPDDEDLEYPSLEIDPSKEELLQSLKELPEDVLIEEEAPGEVEALEEVAEVKPLDKVQKKKLEPKKVEKSFLNQNVLFIVLALLVGLAIAGFYFRKKLIKEFIEARIHIISPVYAQIIPNSVKKKLII